MQPATTLKTTILSRDDETIVARCTPIGSGAIALIRLSGVDTLAIATAMSKMPGNKQLSDQPTHTIHMGWIVDNHTSGSTDIIDQVMMSVMHAPRTFTGQNVVEITAHNNTFVIEAIIEQAIKHGARLAQEGEFTKRAFLQGKIDLLQAEAINELIHAQTQAALKKSLAQLEGTFSSKITVIEQELITTLAWSEASFEFLDEESEFSGQIQQRLEGVLAGITLLKKNFAIQQQLRQGVRIAIIGSVNAGKSSIFNALLGQKRSIVTSIAGTTRDSIEAGLVRNGNFWTLIDTAGLRQTDDIIEQEGIQRSHEEAKKADIIILVLDGSRPLTNQEKRTYNDLVHTYHHKAILVRNKIDLPQQPLAFDLTHALGVTSYDAASLGTLEFAIEEKIKQLFATLESPFLLNQRQYSLLLNLENQLVKIVPLLQTANVAYELISYHLRDAIEQVSELTGKSVTEAGLDKVFKEFCVGK